MTGRASLRIAVGATLIAAFVFSLPFFAFRLQPWPDQGWTLQAAIRHAAGLGLTTQMGAPSADLAYPNYVRLTYFPPLYPLVISGLLRAGLGIESAVKAINAVALIAGVAGWMTLGWRVLRLRHASFLFAALLVFACGAVVPKGGTTDYVYWAALPWWASALLSANLGARRPTRILFSTLAGLLAALLVGFRWAALFLAPAAAAYGLAMILRESSKWRSRIEATFPAAVLPVIAYGGLQHSNRVLSHGSGTVMSSLTPGWHPGRLATAYPFEALVTGPLGLDAVLNRIARIFGPADVSNRWNFLLRVLFPIIIFALIAVLARAVDLELSEQTSFRLLAISTIGVTVAALAYLTLRYNWSGIDWSFLDEPRYFRPLAPMAALVSLGWLLTRRRRRVVVLLLWCAVGYLAQAQVRWLYRDIAVPDEALELFRFEDGLSHRAGIQVIFDNDISEVLIHPASNVTAFIRPEPEDVPKLRTSEPANLWIVRRTVEKSAYQTDPLYDEKRFEALRSRFQPELAWRSSGGAFEVYGARLAPEGPGV